MNSLYSIGEASKALGVSIITLRRGEAESRLIPEHTAGGRRQYDLAKLKPKVYRSGVDTRQTLAYAKDVLEIITVFSARLYGSSSRKNQNWALAEWQKQYESWKINNTKVKASQTALRRQLNAIKRVDVGGHEKWTCDQCGTT